MWGEVTATAGVSWDAGQDVDSLFHFPSAFILPTISCLHSLLLLYALTVYLYVLTCLCLTSFFVFPALFFIMCDKDTPVTAIGQDT